MFYRYVRPLIADPVKGLVPARNGGVCIRVNENWFSFSICPDDEPFSKSQARILTDHANSVVTDLGLQECYTVTDTSLDGIKLHCVQFNPNNYRLQPIYSKYLSIQFKLLVQALEKYQTKPKLELPDSLNVYLKDN